MKKIIQVVLITIIAVLFIAGCSQQEAAEGEEEPIKIGIMLSDVGLGDQSFSDSAFTGLMKARDELGIVFDYRELDESGSYEPGLKELVEEDNDIIIGLGYMVQEELEKVAEENPDQQFVLIDAVSGLENITSVTFKADQGSYLAGVLAALTSDSNTIGFIGGENNDTINQFMHAYREGARSVSSDINVLVEYAGDFGDDQLGAKLAGKMADENADVIFAAAGFTGTGALKEAQNLGIYAIGVDSDQYFHAEKAVITSVMKNIDSAVYELASQLVENHEIKQGQLDLGIDDNGVGLAPVRIVNLTQRENELLEDAKQQLLQ
ncbi:BMP family ABC transporter substrate-binding protein [Sediminibacillus dalangtanensis]|uniref:BMP family ABC transporter substrate-binding protein n=1 Tax=Sediminibacillus dalangtanensis TaxID=2729421 RepID=A0ABX7VWI8_9BACI|nr:BMP family ABC transporter substrate-binding protein [Sediminibacillus dalangtanensis]QTN00136.1 BMP family ABC transporter substrate-binding protein [Sediminibacillus dalangtanensis]